MLNGSFFLIYPRDKFLGLSGVWGKLFPVSFFQIRIQFWNMDKHKYQGHCDGDNECPQTSGKQGKRGE